MMLSEVIAEAQKLIDKHGDHEAFDTKTFPFDGFTFEVAKDLPPDWDMPDGYKFFRMKNYY